MRRLGASSRSTQKGVSVAELISYRVHGPRQLIVGPCDTTSPSGRTESVFELHGDEIERVGRGVTTAVSGRAAADVATGGSAVVGERRHTAVEARDRFALQDA